MHPVKKIYILETSEEAASGLRAQLEALNPGYKIESDHVADRGLVRIVRWQPDLLIASADLGTITGFELSAIIRMIPSCTCMSIILMLMSEEDITGRQSLDSGADLYVLKDDQLAESIQHGLEKLILQPEAAQDLEKRPVNRVLVVDDSRTMRRVLGVILTGIGIAEHLEAEDGIDGIEKLSAQGADLVLVDYTMPRMSGPAMIKQVRKMERFEKLPIVVVTAEGADEVDEAIRAGANEYLSKPFTMQNVRDIVGKFANNLRDIEKGPQAKPPQAAAAPPA